ncbi:MAG: ABC transporter permease, partial [Clostridiales bacterium]|nr:ABC transporter permease [Clostridiales bacterium]
MKRKKSMFRVVMKRLAKNPVAMIGLFILLVLVFVAIFAPLLAPYSPTALDYSAMYSKPSPAHLLGCDGMGRDLLSRLMYGARYSLSLGFIAAMFGFLIGIFFGSIIGYASGKTDMIIMRILDIWSAIPPMLLAILISTSLGAGFVNTIIAMAVGGIPGSIRGTRAMALKEREMEYLEAARSINCNKFKILFKHMAPNIISPAIVG